MFISPKVAIQEGWVKFPTWMDETFQQKCIQPNALDITCDRLFAINQENTFVLSETTKQMRGSYEQYAYSDWWDMQPHTCYDMMSDFYVSVPAGVAGIFVTRSTLNRNGLQVTSGIWDSGFVGNLGGVITNNSGITKLAPHTRVCQLAFIKSEDSGILYAGGYNTKQGEHWAEKEGAK